MIERLRGTPQFNVPQFSPLFRDAVPVSMSAVMAQMLGDYIVDCFESESDDPSLIAMGKQLQAFAENCARYDDRRPAVNQIPPRRIVGVLNGQTA